MTPSNPSQSHLNLQHFAVHEPTFLRRAEVVADTADKSRYFFDASTGTAHLRNAQAENEAILHITGSLSYDLAVEQAHRVDEMYQFRSMFTPIRKLLHSGDLNIAPLDAPVADIYPPLESAPPQSKENPYANARSEFLDGVRYAGIDALALASPLNLALGVSGLGATLDAIDDTGLIHGGLGMSPDPLIAVNGITIALISFTRGISHPEAITPEGHSVLLREFGADRVKTAVASARSRGADFVLVTIDGRAADGSSSRNDREKSARIAADAGADYVVCSMPGIISRYAVHQTPDGRKVPVAASLGSLTSGKRSSSGLHSAVLRVTLRRDTDGSLEMSDRYVPLTRVSGPAGGAPVTSVPIHPAYASDAHIPTAEASSAYIAKQLGSAISLDETHETKLTSALPSRFTVADMLSIASKHLAHNPPREVRKLAKTSITGVAARPSDIRPGCVAIDYSNHATSDPSQHRISADLAAEKGAVLLITDQPATDKIPTITAKDPRGAYLSILNRVRRMHEPITVAVTGTAGKTTTKNMMAEVFSRHYRTLSFKGNFNTVSTSGLAIQHLTEEHEAYIQEVHGGTTNSAHLISTFLEPNIAVITSIGEGHLSQMKSIDNIVKGKLQVADGLRPGGCLILNHDNVHLKNVKPEVRTVRYSYEDSSCEYFAESVTTSGETVHFVAHTPRSTFNVQLALPGLHNVSNALAVIAAATEADVPSHIISAGLSRFVSSGKRQTWISSYGYNILFDAYNSNTLSLTSALETFNKVSPAPDGRRVAILGDMGEQGEKFERNHTDMGELIASLDIHQVFTIGDGGKIMAHAAASLGTDAQCFDSAEELIQAARNYLTPGDTILFKAASSVNLAETVAYRLFGKIGG